MAGNQAGYATLRADRPGMITAINVEPGQVVAAGQPVMKLAQLEEKEVVVSVPENRLAALRASPETSVRLWAETDKTYRGKVREISPIADPVTRTFTVKVGILNAGPEVRLGMTANVLFDTASTPVVLLPLTALTQKDGKDLVWVVEGGENKVEPRQVQIGKFREDGVTILDGLKAGERVVAVGVHKLEAGQVVRPQEQSLSARAAQP